MRAVVLMSTFNGAAHLEEQVRSILDQDFADVTLVIRDDGSSDATPDCLKRFEALPNVRIARGNRLGLPQAFFTLIADAPDGADLYLLADQDDIWHRDKVSAAATALASAPASDPRLYCSRLHLIDSDKNHIGLSPNWKRPPAFGNALIENICTGCTAAFNRAALELLRRGLPDTDPSDATRPVIHHDWWLYLVISAFGRVIFDPVPHIDYRIHDANVVGLPTGSIDNLKRRTTRSRLQNRMGQRIDQAERFYTIYGPDLTPEKREMVEACVAVKNQPCSAIRLLRDTRIFRQRRGDDILWRTFLAAYAARPQLFFPRSA